MVGACISCIVNELKIRPFHKHCSKENWICLMHSFVVENSHKYPLFFLFLTFALLQICALQHPMWRYHCRFANSSYEILLKEKVSKIKLQNFHSSSSESISFYLIKGWWSGGFGYGLWIGILVASGFSVVPIPSLTWKNWYGLSGGTSTKVCINTLILSVFTCR